ncbi:collagen alpha-1(I) chain-like [Hippopotamus amphibius kiboko]|uniref:collagen alpha-1(I) chain-like n=1 Tax=Hippopotamus amphibius kiboko TaxID=575201 RepID=UPI0025923C81|nr:collagen alpha-1(I) chain-like [Hippopotamus amphibius kiboko]
MSPPPHGGQPAPSSASTRFLAASVLASCLVHRAAQHFLNSLFPRLGPSQKAGPRRDPETKAEGRLLPELRALGPAHPTRAEGRAGRGALGPAASSLRSDRPGRGRFTSSGAGVGTEAPQAARAGAGGAAQGSAPTSRPLGVRGPGPGRRAVRKGRPGPRGRCGSAPAALRAEGGGAGAPARPMGLLPPARWPPRARRARGRPRRLSGPWDPPGAEPCPGPEAVLRQLLANLWSGCGCRRSEPLQRAACGAGGGSAPGSGLCGEESRQAPTLSHWQLLRKVQPGPLPEALRTWNDTCQPVLDQPDVAVVEPFRLHPDQPDSALMVDNEVIHDAPTWTSSAAPTPTSTGSSLPPCFEGALDLDLTGLQTPPGAPVTDLPIVLAEKADQRSSQCPRSPVPALNPPARGSSAAPTMADPRWRRGAQDGSFHSRGQEPLQPGLASHDFQGKWG